MKNQQSPSTSGHNEYYELLAQALEAEYPRIEVPEEQRLVTHLLNVGFEREEAGKLINLREHLYENNEMQQRIAEDSHMQFVRWLYENGEISENAE